MPKYEVWYRIRRDDRAPEFVLLDKDYTEAGEMTAQCPRDAYNQAYKFTEDNETTPFEFARPFVVGDVIIDKSTKQSYVLSKYSPNLVGVVWATCKVFD
jgi:hypothetical protein